MIPWHFFRRLAVVYIAVVVLMTLAISPYFSVGWDPQIFAGVGRAIIDDNAIFDLYQASRQQWGDWGFPYPPLYAHLLAPLIGATYVIPLLPDWLMVRAAPVAFDLAVAVLLYLVVLQRYGTRWQARLAPILWLFNPLTLYQTAIQAHQEASWLACVVAAYALITSYNWQGRQRDGLPRLLVEAAVLPSLLMACAVTLKQSAILFYIPYSVYLLFDRRQRPLRLAMAAVLFALVFGGLSLPYHRHSPDFFYLVFVDVSNMPVQTQSAVVWLLGLKGYLIDQTRSTFFLLRYQAPITMGLAGLVALLALRRDRDLFRVGLLTALLFFLTSKKVMGYHYVLLLPFLLAWALPRHRFDLVSIAVVAASWIIVSPYVAPWAKPEHLPLYAAIGTPNTLLWLWLFVHVWRDGGHIRLGDINVTARLASGSVALVAIMIITVGMVLSSLVQPWAAGPPLVQAVLLVGVLAGSLVLAPFIVLLLLRSKVLVLRGHILLALLLVPVYFAAFALTQESTRIIEGLLQ